VYLSKVNKRMSIFAKCAKFAVIGLAGMIMVIPTKADAQCRMGSGPDQAHLVTDAGTHPQFQPSVIDFTIGYLSARRSL
jgi:hypothetical protein